MHAEAKSIASDVEITRHVHTRSVALGTISVVLLASSVLAYLIINRKNLKQKHNFDNAHMG